MLSPATSSTQPRCRVLEPSTAPITKDSPRLWPSPSFSRQPTVPLPCGLVQVVTGMALFTMLRFPLSFAFIIAVQFINMKTSLKRISTFLENPELDPAALEGARRGRPSRELLPTASPSATIIEVAVERADKAEGSARAPLRAAEVNLVEANAAPSASPPPSPPLSGIGHCGRGGRGRGRGRGALAPAPSPPPSPPAQEEAAAAEGAPYATMCGSFFWEPPVVPAGKGKGKGKGKDGKKGQKKKGGRGAGAGTPPADMAGASDAARQSKGGAVQPTSPEASTKRTSFSLPADNGSERSVAAPRRALTRRSLTQRFAAASRTKLEPGKHPVDGSVPPYVAWQRPLPASPQCGRDGRI
jgi:hypothetical protein